MTNIIAQTTILLTLATNWTGFHDGDRELGYVVTNHIARIEYQGETNEFQLKSVRSDTAVWRSYNQIATNFYYGPLWWTNYGIQCYTNSISTNYLIGL